MPAPRFRSRTLRRVSVRKPGGTTTRHYRRRKNAKPVCAQCKAQLPGVARGTPTQVRSLSKSARRPERPYGGVLCGACMRRTIIAKIK